MTLRDAPDQRIDLSLQQPRKKQYFLQGHQRMNRSISTVIKKKQTKNERRKTKPHNKSRTNHSP